MKIINLIFLISVFFTYSSLSDETTSWELLKEGGKVVFIRHAYAPGGGDPNNFELYDCSTQRNLNEQGINQSKRMGKLFSEYSCLLYTSPSPRDQRGSRMPSSA